jgi:hypothetical protein
MADHVHIHRWTPIDGGVRAAGAVDGTWALRRADRMQQQAGRPEPGGARHVAAMERAKR